MEKIFTTKISLQSSNPTFSYPIIRLPRELKGLAGRIANIYQTEIDGVQGFFVALQLDKLDKFVDDTVQADQKLYQAPIDQSTLKIKGRGRDSNPRRGLHRAIGLPCYPTSAQPRNTDSPVRIRTAVAGFLLSVAQDHMNPKARMIDHYTTGLSG